MTTPDFADVLLLCIMAAFLGITRMAGGAKLTNGLVP
jgi:hypothetical protein